MFLRQQENRDCTLFPSRRGAPDDPPPSTLFDHLLRGVLVTEEHRTGVDSKCWENGQSSTLAVGHTPALATIFRENNQYDTPQWWMNDSPRPIRDDALYHILDVLLIRCIPREDTTLAAFLDDLGLHFSELGNLHVQCDIVNCYVKSIVCESEGDGFFLCLERPR
ncbi:uncharacterized protein ARMOST_02498 [Armillaria ostoyae]|uniref:Uncharacterized protein n=1 Tax=Armillaria ostoyae TaxID=47428 RepID=A0A284QRY4_ARMOS|nr:uncharacterized protein ARMOST_02498 [Armillaria ostoyae]